MQPTQKAYRYKMSFRVIQVNIGITFQCSMGFIYKRGREQHNPPFPIQFSLKDSAAMFPEDHQLSIPCVFFKNTAQGTNYLPFMPYHLIRFYINTHKGRKSAGVAKFMPHVYLNQKEGIHRVHLRLEKSPDPDSNALVEFRFTRVSEMDDEELISEVEKVGQGNVSALTMGGDMSVLTSLNATRSFNNT